MIESYRVKNSKRGWNHPPAGYEQLSADDIIQDGDVQRMNDEWYCEYKGGLLTNGKLGKCRVGNGIWYRKSGESPSLVERHKSKVMKNDRVFQEPTDITEFSKSLMAAITQLGSVIVKTRSGAMYEIVHNEENQCFHTKDWGLVWNNDGSSVKNHDLDIIEAEI